MLRAVPTFCYVIGMKDWLALKYSRCLLKTIQVWLKKDSNQVYFKSGYCRKSWVRLESGKDLDFDSKFQCYDREKIKKRNSFGKYISKSFHTSASPSSILDICLFLHHWFFLHLCKKQKTNIPLPFKDFTSIVWTWGVCIILAPSDPI